MDTVKMNLETIKSLAYEISENMSVVLTEGYVNSIGERIIHLVDEVEKELVKA